MAMRYYEYLSEAKVEMLYPQIDQSSRSAGGEVGFDLKLVKASRRTDGQRGLTLYEKLAAVEDWIYAKEPVGTVDEPQPWIYGRMRMVACISWDRRARRRTGQPAEVLLYAGITDTGASMLLGGSVRHLVGGRPGPLRGHDALAASTSLHAFLMHYLNSPRAFSNDEDPPYGSERVVPDVIAEILTDPANPKAEYEVLAKRLSTGGHRNRGPVTLATPLFTALTE